MLLECAHDRAAVDTEQPREVVHRGPGVGQPGDVGLLGTGKPSLLRGSSRGLEMR